MMSARCPGEVKLHITYLARYIGNPGFSIAKPSGKHDMINLEDAVLAVATDNSNRPPLALGTGLDGENSSRSPDV